MTDNFNNSSSSIPLENDTSYIDQSYNNNNENNDTTMMLKDDDDDDDVEFQSSATNILNHLTDSEAEYDPHDQLPSIEEVRTNLSAGTNNNALGGGYRVTKNKKKKLDRKKKRSGSRRRTDEDPTKGGLYFPDQGDDEEDDYNPGDQLPSIEDYRTQRAIDQMTKPLTRSKGAGNEEKGANTNTSHFVDAFNNNNEWRSMFYVLLLILFALAVGLIVGFGGGEKYEKLKEDVVLEQEQGNPFDSTSPDGLPAVNNPFDFHGETVNTPSPFALPAVDIITNAPIQNQQRPIPLPTTTKPKTNVPSPFTMSPILTTPTLTATTAPISPYTTIPSLLWTPSPTILPITPSPTQTPTTTATATATATRLEIIQKWLIDGTFALQRHFDDTASNQLKASQWLADKDVAKLKIPDDNYQTVESRIFLERYVVALFYFSTSTFSEEDAFTAQPDGWDNSYEFLTRSSVCDWQSELESAGVNEDQDYRMGVTCNDQKIVVSISIPHNNLQGSLISELGLLTNLNSLDLNHNMITDQLPGELSELVNLSYLALHYNELSGKFPSWIRNLSNLKVLGLGDNKFTGTIPADLGDTLNQLVTLGIDNNSITGPIRILEELTNLERLYLGDNDFSEDINSVDWSKLTNLSELDLVNNNLTGEIPLSLLKNMPSLQVLSLANNNIEGRLPLDYPKESPLKYLALQSNSIGGSIHSSIGNMVNLTHLDLTDNALTGRMPAHMGYLTNMKYLFLSRNKNFRAGGIPQFLEKMTELKDLSLMSTNRVGAIPGDILQQLSNLLLLDLDDNDLTGEIPDELGDLTNLSYLMINRNQELTGTVPTSLQQLPRLDILMIDRTSLKGNLDSICSRIHRAEIIGADCIINDEGDVNATSDNDDGIQCTCCNICCSATNVDSHNDNDDFDNTDLFGDSNEDDNRGEQCQDKVFFGQVDPIWENSYKRKQYQFDGQVFQADDDDNNNNKPTLGASSGNGTTLMGNNN